MFDARKTRYAAVLAGLALVVSACGGIAKPAQDGGPVELRATNLLPPENAQSDMIDWFMSELEKRTNGEVKTEVVYGGALVSGAETLPGMQQGRAEAGNVVPAYFPAELPLNNINMVPMPGADQAARVRALQRLADENEAFGKEFEDNQIKLMGYLPNTSSAVAVSSTLDSIDDFKGTKIRIPAQPASAVYEELGAEPVFMPSEEVYESVERGIVDGVTYPMDVEVANGITEVATTMAPDVGQNGGSIFALSRRAYDDLSENAKQVIADLQAEWAAKSDELLAKYEKQACEEFLAAGGEIKTWSEADKKRLAEITDRIAPPVWKQEAAKAGFDAAPLDTMWNTYSAAVAELSSESDYEDGLLACGR